MRLHPHLSFNGDCEAAFKFYENALNAKITFSMTYGESPMKDKMPPEMRDKVIHTTLTWGDQVLSGADAPSGSYQTPQGTTVTVDIDDPAEAERIFAALSQNGKVMMPIQETFWANRFGMVVDQYQVPWMVNCGKEPEAVQK
jgi:PhnB protein